MNSAVLVMVVGLVGVLAGCEEHVAPCCIQVPLPKTSNHYRYLIVIYKTHIAAEPAAWAPYRIRTVCVT